MAAVRATASGLGALPGLNPQEALGSAFARVARAVCGCVSLSGLLLFVDLIAIITVIVVTVVIIVIVKLSLFLLLWWEKACS